MHRTKLHAVFAVRLQIDSLGCSRNLLPQGPNFGVGTLLGVGRPKQGGDKRVNEHPGLTSY